LTIRIYKKLLQFWANFVDKRPAFLWNIIVILKLGTMVIATLVQMLAVEKQSILKGNFFSFEIFTG
jgi:hypothetical protein